MCLGIAHVNRLIGYLQNHINMIMSALATRRVATMSDSALAIGSIQCRVDEATDQRRPPTNGMCGCRAIITSFSKAPSGRRSCSYSDFLLNHIETRFALARNHIRVYYGTSEEWRKLQ